MYYYILYNRSFVIAYIRYGLTYTNISNAFGIIIVYTKYALIYLKAKNKVHLTNGLKKNILNYLDIQYKNHDFLFDSPSIEYFFRCSRLEITHIIRMKFCQIRRLFGFKLALA